MTENKTPRVSVIMPAYNAEPYIVEAVDSILGQTFDDFEFIVIDDGSTDGTRGILASYDDPRLVLVRNKQNIGLTRSLNKGLALARGEYIARQDADDISLPTRLEQQARFLDSHPDVGLLGTSWICMNAAGQDLKVIRTPTDDAQMREALLVSWAVEHGSVMLRQDCITAVGNYRAVAGNAEDLDLWLRIAESFGIGNLTEPLYKHRVHATSVVGSGLRRHLDSVYRVRKMALQRWQEAGKAVSSPPTIARCNFLMARHDFASGRIEQGKTHLQQALSVDPALLQAHRQNAADIATFALWVCKMSNTPTRQRWLIIGRHYIDETLSHLSHSWSLSVRRVFAHFLITLSFDAYASARFVEVIRYALHGMLYDTHWCLDRGLWRIMGHSLFRCRAPLATSH